jgi:hypothetical protein
VNINTRQAQGSLVGIYLLFLSASLGAILYLQLVGGMFVDEAIQALIVLIKVYSVPLGVILAGIFAQGKIRAQKVQSNPFIVAIAVSLMWNLLLAWRTAAYVTAVRSDVQTYIAGIQEVGNQASFLAAGALTFFFTKGRT